MIYYKKNTLQLTGVSYTSLSLTAMTQTAMRATNTQWKCWADTERFERARLKDNNFRCGHWILVCAITTPISFGCRNSWLILRYYTYRLACYLSENKKRLWIGKQRIHQSQASTNDTSSHGIALCSTIHFRY